MDVAGCVDYGEVYEIRGVGDIEIWDESHSWDLDVVHKMIWSGSHAHDAMPLKYTLSPSIGVVRKIGQPVCMYVGLTTVVAYAKSLEASLYETGKCSAHGQEVY